MEQAIDFVSRQDRQDPLIPLHPVRNRQVINPALEGLISGQSGDGRRKGSAHPTWQSSPQGAIADTAMAPIPAKQFVRSLSYQCHLDIVAGSFTDEIHRNDRGSCDRLFQASNNFRECLLENRSRNRDRGMLRSQYASGLCAVRQLVVGKGRTVSHRVGRPGTSVEIHQGQKQPGIDTAAQKQPDGHIADELASHGLFIESQQLLSGKFRRFCRRKRNGLESVPSIHLARAVLDRQLGSRGEFTHPLEYGVWRGRVAVAQEEVQRSRVYLRRLRHRGTNRTQLRAEIQTVAINSIVDLLDPEWIPGQDQPPVPRIPDAETEHTIESIEHIIAPLLVSMNDDLCIRFRVENVAITFQFTSELEKVIDFTVENHPDRFFPVRHGLMPPGQVDNREPAKAKSERSGDIVSLVITASMHEGLGHRLNVTTTDGLQTTEVKLSTNTAHLTTVSAFSYQGVDRKTNAVPNPPALTLAFRL